MQINENIAIGGNGLSGAIGQNQLQTEGMDFLDFLLGLQGKPEQALLDEILNPEMVGASASPEETGKDVLLDLFQVKKEDPSSQLQGALLAAGWSVDGVDRSLPAQGELTPINPTQNREMSLADIDVQIRSPEIAVSNLGPEQKESLNSAGVTIEKVEVFDGERVLEDLPENQANRLSLEQNIREVQNQPKEKNVNTADASKEGVRNIDNPIQSKSEQVEVVDREMISTEDNLKETQVTAESEGPELSHREVKESSWAPNFKSGDANSNGIQNDVVMKGEDNVEIKSSVSELTTKIDHLARQGGGKMTVSLNPPELGSVEIDVMSKGNHVEVKMRSDNDFAKSALEKHFGDLKISLGSHELVLSKAEVVVSKDPIPTGTGFADLPNSSSEQRAFNFQQQGSGQGNHDRGNSNPFVERRPVRNIETAFMPRAVRNHGDGLDLRI